jgi:hypothetical protein
MIVPLTITKACSEGAISGDEGVTSTVGDGRAGLQPVCGAWITKNNYRHSLVLFILINNGAEALWP